MFCSDWLPKCDNTQIIAVLDGHLMLRNAERFHSKERFFQDRRKGQEQDLLSAGVGVGEWETITCHSHVNSPKAAK